MKDDSDDDLSPEAAAYLHDLRTLSFEDFRRKHHANVNAERAADARRRERSGSKERICADLGGNGPSRCPVHP